MLKSTIIANSGFHTLIDDWRYNLQAFFYWCCVNGIAFLPYEKIKAFSEIFEIAVMLIV